MPEIVSSIPDKSKYPWAEWLDGQVRLFKQGEDFEGDPNRFRTAAAVAGRRLGLLVRTRVRPEGVYVEAYGRIPVEDA